MARGGRALLLSTSVGQRAAGAPGVQAGFHCDRSKVTGNTLPAVLPMQHTCCAVRRPHESCVGRVGKWFGQQSRVAGRRLADPSVGLLARLRGFCRLLAHLPFLTFTSLERCNVHAVTCTDHYIFVRRKSLSSRAVISLWAFSFCGSLMSLYS